MARPLDEDVPLGDPGAVSCRWCGTGRVITQGGQGVICIACDTNTHTMPEPADTA